jgi:hypothetical protein
MTIRPFGAALRREAPNHRVLRVAEGSRVTWRKDYEAYLTTSELAGAGILWMPDRGTEDLTRLVGDTRTDTGVGPFSRSS